MTADWGIVFGLTGIGVALLSLVYARTQAIHARRQADAAYVATSLQLQREMSDRINKARMELMRDPAAAKMYLAAIPELARLVPEGSGLDTIVMIRNAIDGLQDMYFLRKRSIVDGHHWRSWIFVSRHSAHADRASDFRQRRCARCARSRVRRISAAALRWSATR
jgi:hypothetical protein